MCPFYSKQITVSYLMFNTTNNWYLKVSKVALKYPCYHKVVKNALLSSIPLNLKKIFAFHPPPSKALSAAELFWEPPEMPLPLSTLPWWPAEWPSSSPLLFHFLTLPPHPSSMALYGVVAVFTKIFSSKNSSNHMLLLLCITVTGRELGGVGKGQNRGASWSPWRPCWHHLCAVSGIQVAAPMVDRHKNRGDWRSRQQC